jgi:hypothetical protein
MRVELRINVSSDVTWMNKAESGFRNPSAPSRIPRLSTAIRSDEILHHDRFGAPCDAHRFNESRKIVPRPHDVGALASHIGPREPIATPIVARVSAGASFTPSPIIATILPASTSLPTYALFSSGNSSATTSSTLSARPPLTSRKGEESLLIVFTMHFLKLII